MGIPSSVSGRSFNAGLDEDRVQGFGLVETAREYMDAKGLRASTVGSLY